jgi:hypothetical protein
MSRKNNEISGYDDAGRRVAGDAGSRISEMVQTG